MTIKPTRQALIGGVLVFLGAMLGGVLIGGIYSDTRARVLIEAMAPSLRTLCFAIITASATILSLLLTTVGFTQRLNQDFDIQFYDQIKSIAQTSSLSLVLAVTILLTLTMPLTETDSLRSWFTIMYYVLMVSSAVLAALIVATIIMIYQTVVHIIHAVYPST